MKKMLRLLLFSAALAVMLSVGAFAAGERGIYGITAQPSFAIEATGETADLDVDNDSATDAVPVYTSASSVSVTYNAATVGKQYLLLVTDAALTDGVVPTEGNIQYIDQDAPTEGTTVTFSTVYPKSLASGKTYYVYLSSDDEALTPLTLAGTFKYYAAYIRGDADGDNGVYANDAMLILQYSVGIIDDTRLNTAAADVDGDGNIYANDAMLVLQRSVGILDESFTRVN